jgi:RHS repeat-associated protein
LQTRSCIPKKTSFPLGKSIKIKNPPPAGHYSFTYTPSFAGPTWTTSFAFNSNSSSTHTFLIDNISMCPINAVQPITSYSADILMHTDYYAFGQQQPGRTWQGTAEGYRYSHNSHEKEDALFKGAQSAEYWMYDSRIGRRWERDPVVKPMESRYAAFNNNPILYADPKGLDGEARAKKHAEKTGGDARDLGNGKWEVVTAKEGKDSEYSSTGKEMDVDIKTFKDNIFEKIGKGLSNLEGKMRGNWKSGRELEGAIGSFKLGGRTYESNGSVTLTQEIGIYSYNEDNIGFYRKTGVDVQQTVGTEGVSHPFKLDAGAEIFVQVNTTDDGMVDARSEISSQGTYASTSGKAKVYGPASVSMNQDVPINRKGKANTTFEISFGKSKPFSGSTGVKYSESKTNKTKTWNLSK